MRHDPDDEPAVRPTGRRGQRLRRVALAAVALTTAFFGLTAAFGLPAPGELRRHPYSELRSLADRINESAGPMRTPDDCWRELTGADGPLREIADVDHVRSRVIVRAFTGNQGVIDPLVWNSVIERVDAVLETHPGGRWGMVQIEPGPDGWSPLVSCRLVTRGWVRQG